MKSQDFGQSGLLTFWNSLSVDQRAELVENLNNFHALVSSLSGRGFIETNKAVTEITVIKEDPDVEALRVLLKKINVPGITILPK